VVSHPSAAVTGPSTKVMVKISSPTAMEAELQAPDGSCRGVYCANPKCGKIMSLEETWPLQATEDGKISWRLVAHPVICPHCKTEATYLLQQVQTFSRLQQAEDEGLSITLAPYQENDG
jgi:phage terminase large subunit GpA-like protein